MRQNRSHLNHIYTLLISIFCLFQVSAIAQNEGDLRGFILDKKTGDPLIFATVNIEELGKGTTTDVNGFYSIARVPVGTYTVKFSYIGFEDKTQTVEINDGRITTVRVELDESAVMLKGVEVSAQKQEQRKEVKASQISISPKMIQKLPSIGGEADVAQYLQLLPGVVMTGDQGGQVYIRGGTPIQTKFLMDGMTIYNPFHSIGLFSVYETDVLKNVDVYTGGFNAEYGNRISAVVDVTTRDGNKKRVAGKVSANPFVAKGIFEAPLMKQKEDGSFASVLLTYKNSYLRQSSPLFYPYADSSGIPYNFEDYYGKMSFGTSNGTKGSFFGFKYSDTVNFINQANYNWDAFGGGFKFIIVPGKSNIFINTDFNFSKYELALDQGDGLNRRSSIAGFDLGMDFTYFIKDGNVKFGLDITGNSTEYEFTNFLGLDFEENQNTTELGAFFALNKHTEKVVVEPSLRLQYYGSLGALSPEPRLGIKYNTSDKVRMKFATGIYSQNFISTRSDRDVVNLFNGFLSGPEQTLTDINGEEASNKLQRAFHLITGVEYDIFTNASINIEPYYKHFFQLININRFKTLPIDPDYLIEKGDAYGIDLSFKYDYDQLYVWTTYSLGRVVRNNGEQIYPPHFDRRHNFNVFTSYTFGKDLDWEVSARWNMGTGFPFTKTKGFYERLDPQDGAQTDPATANGNLGIIFDPIINGGRLPVYHRLDFAAKKKFALGTHTSVDVSASITNVYDRENIFFQDRVRGNRINQLPILPAMGVAFNF